MASRSKFSFFRRKEPSFFRENRREAWLLLLELDNLPTVCLERWQQNALDFLYRKARLQFKLQCEFDSFFGNHDWFERFQETYSRAVSYFSMIRSPKRSRRFDVFSWIRHWLRVCMDKKPAAASSLACGTDSGGRMLVSAPYPHEKNILSSQLDDCSNPCSDDAQRITSSVKTAHAPMLHELSNPELQYARGIDLPTRHDMLQANGDNMINDRPYRTVPHRILLDNASPVHVSGFSLWFDMLEYQEYQEDQEKNRKYVQGVGDGKLIIKGCGAIRDENFRVKDVSYIPGLNIIDPGRGEIICYKTLLSQDTLRLEKCAFDFPLDGSVTVYRGTHPWMPWRRRIVGKGHADGNGYFLMDYLKITDDEPEPTLWTVAGSVWNTMRWLLRDREQDMLIPW